MKIHIIRDPRVAHRVGDLCVAFAIWLIQHQTLQHNLKVYLAPLAEIPTCKGQDMASFVQDAHRLSP